MWLLIWLVLNLSSCHLCSIFPYWSFFHYLSVFGLFEHFLWFHFIFLINLWLRFFFCYFSDFFMVFSIYLSGSYKFIRILTVHFHSCPSIFCAIVIFQFIFLMSLLKCNSYTIQFNHLKCTVMGVFFIFTDKCNHNSQF